VKVTKALKVKKVHKVPMDLTERKELQVLLEKMETQELQVHLELKVLKMLLEL